MKKILIIGGTQFAGRVLVEELIKENKYDITLFNRGTTNPGIFPRIKKIKGDRNTEDIKLITNQSWDCIIDIAGYYPKSIEKLLNSSIGKIGRYIFISTLSHFKFDINNPRLISEEYETLDCSVEQSVDTNMHTYNERKAECERVLLKYHQQDKIILRPAIIFGKYDPTDRLYYWLYRAMKNRDILIPNNGKNVISYTYVNDLAKAIIQSIEIKKHTEIYNVSTIPQLSLESILNISAANKKRYVKLVNATAGLLKENKINPWSDMPLWVDGNWFVFDNKKVKTDFNIDFLPFEECITDTLEYHESLGWPIPKYGISLEKENELLKKV